MNELKPTTGSITNLQRESRHSLPILLCVDFFPTAQKKLKFYCYGTNGTFGFDRHTRQSFVKPKEPYFAAAPVTTTVNKFDDIRNLIKN